MSPIYNNLYARKQFSLVISPVRAITYMKLTLI